MPELNQEQAITQPILTLTEAVKSGRFVRIASFVSELTPC